MGFLDKLRKIKIPAPKEVFAIPGQLKTISKNQKLNTINVRYWDRHFRHPKDFIGTVITAYGIPLVYFESPQALAIILLDDCTYMDEQGKEWVEVAEDYLFGIDRNSELAQFVDQIYYNDFSEKRVKSIEDYKIPVLLNHIPREVVKINLRTRAKAHDNTEIIRKAEVTQNILRLMSKVNVLTGIGKQDNSAILVGCLLGGSIGIIIGIFISFAFLVN